MLSILFGRISFGVRDERIGESLSFGTFHRFAAHLYIRSQDFCYPIPGNSLKGWVINITMVYVA